MRCLKQLETLGRNKTVKQHSHCAIHLKDTITKGLSLDFIWGNFSKYIMKCALENEIPTKENTLDYVIKETKNLIKS